jgi:hypothetical protein
MLDDASQSRRPERTLRVMVSWRAPVMQAPVGAGSYAAAAPCLDAESTSADAFRGVP